MGVMQTLAGRARASGRPKPGSVPPGDGSAYSRSEGRASWPGWRHLPRDARDTLFLLAVIAWTVLPHVEQLPLWCSVFTGMVLLWRGRLALTNAALPRRWVVVAALVMVGVLTWKTHRSLLGREAGITLVVALMALKTLELRARRDAFVVFFLGFFIVLTQFLQSQSLPTAIAMLVSVWGLLTALVLAHRPVGQPSLKHAATLSARTALLGAPIMVLLFMLFPRIGPLWGVPQDSTSKTGLSNSLTMGSVAELAQDESIALRLRFTGPMPPQQQMYLRGPVLGAFDGHEWKRLEPSFPARTRPHADLKVSGTPYTYEMTLEPQRSNVLPLLEIAPDTPEAAPRIEGQRTTLRDDLQWQTDRPVNERLRFNAQAYAHYSHGPVRLVTGLQDYLYLPPGYNPRTLAWAADLRSDPRYAQADARSLAVALMQHIASGGYSYTLDPGRYGDSTGHNAVDEFWLDRKVGFCEHFASAFVVIMRALDVPARIVTGYQGADSTLVDGYMIVRNSYAHAWAEYWQPGVGWLRADPTAAVSPDRIGLSRSLSSRPGFVASAIDSVSPNLLANLRQHWEALNNRWNQTVLSYSRSAQADLLKRLGVSSPSWEDLSYLLILVLSCASLVGAGWAWWDRRRQDPWTRLSNRIRAGLSKLGIEALPHHAPRRLASAVRQRGGHALADLLDELDRERYAAGARRLPSLRWRRQFERELRALLRQPRSGLLQPR
jgi:protein-glutamine gamma-glutamyltransferase